MPVATSQQHPRPRRPDPVLITEAAPSFSEQHAARKKRYAITMAVRGVCVLLAAVFYQTVWLMLLFAILGAILPWIAVVMANDRPPRKRADLRRPLPRPDRILENPQRPGRVIEH
jgi:amino acid transporter